jgi:hypothetical protein
MIFINSNSFPSGTGTGGNRPVLIMLKQLVEPCWLINEIVASAKRTGLDSFDYFENESKN